MNPKFLMELLKHGAKAAARIMRARRPHLCTLPSRLASASENHGMVVPESFALCCTGIALSGIMPPMKYWEIVSDKLSAGGWSCGYLAAP